MNLFSLLILVYFCGKPFRNPLTAIFIFLPTSLQEIVFFFLVFKCDVFVSKHRVHKVDRVWLCVCPHAQEITFQCMCIISYRGISVHVSVFKKFEIFIDCVYKAI